MADLMASLSAQPLTLSRGEEVEGKIIVDTSSEFIIDLKTKTEGVISKRDFAEDKLQTLKVGDNVKAYVVIPENESGQAVLSLVKQVGKMDRRGREQTLKWQKFVQAQNRKAALSGKVTEVNKGGLVVEVEGVRGFVPSSHVGLETLAKVASLEELVGRSLVVNVLEVDPGNNRLIFSARKAVTEETKQKLSQFDNGQKIKGKIAAVMPFGLFLDLGGVEGFIFANEISWSSSTKATDDKEIQNLLQQFQVGQEIEGVVTGRDENLGRVNLSIRQMQEDPFAKIAENYQADDVITGTVKSSDQNGVTVELEDGVEGFVPADKVEIGSEYQIGQRTNFLVDSVDLRTHRINLAPFLTSTKGLIYK